MRHLMEDRLINSFSTPFDRQHIYDLSRQMDYIQNFSEETAISRYEEHSTSFTVQSSVSNEKKHIQKNR